MLIIFVIAVSASTASWYGFLKFAALIINVIGVSVHWYHLAWGSGAPAKIIITILSIFIWGWWSWPQRKPAHFSSIRHSLQREKYIFASVLRHAGHSIECTQQVTPESHWKDSLVLILSHNEKAMGTMRLLSNRQENRMKALEYGRCWRAYPTPYAGMMIHAYHHWWEPIFCRAPWRLLAHAQCQ